MAKNQQNQNRGGADTGAASAEIDQQQAAARVRQQQMPAQRETASVQAHRQFGRQIVRNPRDTQPITQDEAVPLDFGEGIPQELTRDGKRTRAGMIDAIRRGGCVLYNGQHILREIDLPSEAELAQGDEVAQREALAGLDRLQAQINEQKAMLLRGANRGGGAATGQPAGPQGGQAGPQAGRNDGGSDVPPGGAGGATATAGNAANVTPEEWRAATDDEVGKAMQAHRDQITALPNYRQANNRDEAVAQLVAVNARPAPRT